MIKLKLGSHYQALIIATIIGVGVGLLVTGFLELIEWVQWLFFHGRSEKLFASIARLSPWWVILLTPALGGLVAGLLIYWFIPDKRNHGVADVIESCALKGGHIDTKTGLVAIIAAGTALGTGGSVGREGPAVHVGATLGSWLAQRLKLTVNHSLTLVGCGVAAAVAASFNAPIAGVFFAIEVIVGQYALKVFAPVVIASVSSTLVIRSFVGDTPAFSLPDHTITSLWEIFAFGLLGSISAFLGFALIRSIGEIQRRWSLTKIPAWVRPGVAGLGVGAIGIFVPEVLSVGYEATNLALTESLSWKILFVFLLAKFVATVIALGSGMPGGVFSPSLFLGAMLGGVFWYIIQPIVPELASSQNAYAIVGMASVAAAVLGAPISTLLIVFELTADYKLTVAVMIGTTMANLMLRQLGYTSFFHWQLASRNVDVRQDRSKQLLHTHSIENLISQQFGIAQSMQSLRQGCNILADSTYYILFLVNADGSLSGSLRSKHLMAAMVQNDSEMEMDQWALSRHVSVLPNASLQTALEMMTEHDINYLPVVKDFDQYEVEGIVYQVDLLDYANHSLAV